MTRFMIPLLLALVVGSPAWGGMKNISLHCNGEVNIHLNDGNTRNRESESGTFLMAWNGSWVELWGERVKRTAGRDGGSDWIYTREKDNLKVHFTVAEMKLFISSEGLGRKVYHYLYCFPFTHPFPR
jgi:hypothetical protein